MKNFILVVLLFMPIAITTCSLPKTPQAPQTLVDAQALHKKGHHQEALDLVNEILIADSNNLDAHELRGKLLFHFHDTLHADEEFAKVLAEDSSDRSRSKRMEAQIDWDFEHHRDEQAMALIKEELKLLKEDSATHASMVKHAVRNALHHADTSAAISILQGELKERKTWQWLHLSLAHIHHDQHKYKEAAKHYQAYTAKVKAGAAVHYDAGMCYLHLNNKSAALPHLKQAAEIGHTRACQQYRKLTAITRYKTYSRCCDGTSSSSTGRGTCSHHGGVCSLIKEPHKEYTVECR